MKTCKICGADISERKGNAKYCPKCSKEKALERNRHYKNRQKNYCQRCGKDITKQSRYWKLCPECKAAQKRVCKLCGADISDRLPNAKYCLDCRQKQTRKQPNAKIFSNQQCKTCKYRSNDPDFSCNYISVTGHRRNCPQPPNCTKYEKGKRILKKWQLNYSMRGEFE